MKKLVVILGPTASGKTALAIKLATKYHGEIINCDSRQIYKGMDIGTGKVTKEEQKEIPHHLLDIVSPRQRFSVAQFQKLANQAIKKILRKGKIPFLVGGSGLYIQAITEGLVFPKGKSGGGKLRAELEKLSKRELFFKLQRLDPLSAEKIDRKNIRRLARAVE